VQYKKKSKFQSCTPAKKNGGGNLKSINITLQGGINKQQQSKT
jgi:hypothetical protein